MGLKNQEEWAKYAKGGNKPEDIPAGPARVYKDKGWKGYGDWLGTGAIANQKRRFYSFEESKKIIHSLSLDSRTHWREYVKSEKKPQQIPANPPGVYKRHWKGWGDWLGTANIAPSNREFRSFDEARKFAKSLNLKGQRGWAKYCKLNKLPLDVPVDPRRVYKSLWKGWGDWLDTGNVAPKDRKYRDFFAARS